MSKEAKQHEIWPDNLPIETHNIADVVVTEKLQFRYTVPRWVKRSLSAMAILTMLAMFGFSSYLQSNKEKLRLAEVNACQKKCSPRFGQIVGESRIPHASRYERRYFEINTNCVCS